jgi:hypothetical protein
MKDEGPLCIIFQDKRSNLLKAKQQPKRMKLDPNVPKQQEIIEAPSQCECGNKDLRKIGEDISKILTYILNAFSVKEQSVQELSVINAASLCKNMLQVIQ